MAASQDAIATPVLQWALWMIQLQQRTVARPTGVIGRMCACKAKMVKPTVAARMEQRCNLPPFGID